MFKIGEKVKGSKGEGVIIEVDNISSPIIWYTVAWNDFTKTVVSEFNIEKIYNVDDVQRYGDILDDDEIIDCNNHWYRFKLMKYEGKIFYVVMKDGEILKFEKVNDL